MNGVDKHDQLQMKYNIGQFSVKAWKYLLWFFVNACLVNAYNLYAKTSTRPTKKYAYLYFRLDVAYGLIAGFSARKQKSGALQHIRPGALNDQLTYENVHMGVKKQKDAGGIICKKGEKKQYMAAGFAMSICAKMAAILNITANSSIRIKFHTPTHPYPLKPLFLAAILFFYKYKQKKNSKIFHFPHHCKFHVTPQRKTDVL